MIIVVATVELTSEDREEFLAIFRELVPSVLAEEGCIEYGPTVDFPTTIPVQVAERKQVVTIVEKWESIEALEAHLVAPHMVAYREKVKSLVAGVQLQVLQPV